MGGEREGYRMRRGDKGKEGAQEKWGQRDWHLSKDGKNGDTLNGEDMGGLEGKGREEREIMPSLGKKPEGIILV